ncbi:MAG TPA: hypothetical protein PLL54_10285 [Dermatophilaceae bacterium]|nr:hypothetical protein [Dermatophilaceae bacterium]
MASQLQQLAGSVRALADAQVGLRQQTHLLATAATTMSRQTPRGSTPSQRALDQALATAARAASAADAELASFGAEALAFARHLTGESELGTMLHGAWNMRGQLAKAAATEVLPTLVGQGLETGLNADKLGDFVTGVYGIVRDPNNRKLMGAHVHDAVTTVKGWLHVR